MFLSTFATCPPPSGMKKTCMSMHVGAAWERIFRISERGPVPACGWLGGGREMGSFCYLPLARDARQPLGPSIGQQSRSQLFVNAQVKGKRSLRSGTQPRGILHTTG
jgi:hypothetical protein